MTVLEGEVAAAPVFAAINGGPEAYAQLAEHIARKPDRNPDRSRFDDSAALQHGVHGSNATFDVADIHRGTGETVERHAQIAAVSWSGFVADPACGSCLDKSPLAIRGEMRAAD